MNLARTLQSTGMLALWRAVSVMPDALSYQTMEAIFARQYRRGDAQVARVRNNLAPIVPPEELERIVEEAFRWYGRYWAETFRASMLSTAAISARTSAVGTEHLDRAVADGTGAVIPSMHLGNYDIGGRWVADRFPLVAVAEVLEPRAVFERFLRVRRKLGMQIVPLERGADVIGACIDHVRQGKLIALLADRDLSQRGIEVSFFGRRARMAAGPAVIAARTGAPLIPSVMYQVDDGSFRFLVNEPLPPPPNTGPAAIAATMQRIAEVFEGFIRRAPAQWHMFQRFWPEEPA